MGVMSSPPAMVVNAVSVFSDQAIWAERTTSWACGKRTQISEILQPYFKCLEYQMIALSVDLVTINPVDVLGQVDGCALVKGCDLRD